MYHVFIANIPIKDGMLIHEQLTNKGRDYVIVDSTSDSDQAYDTMANLQYTLPAHCTVGVVEDSTQIVCFAFSGLNRSFNR